MSTWTLPYHLGIKTKYYLQWCSSSGALQDPLGNGLQVVLQCVLQLIHHVANALKPGLVVNFASLLQHLVSYTVGKDSYKTGIG